MEPESLASLIAASLPSDIRIETLKGVEYLVVPVVAMMGDAVVWPANSPHPQLVPASELEKIPVAWNGRPVISNHPFDTMGNPLSANTPEIAETLQFGYIYNAEFDGDLKLEAWLDIESARKMGGDPLDVLERCERREVIEISVGNFAQSELKPGVQDGKPYFSIWRNIVPDHLAMLPAGVVGACSNDMGCGAPRTNSEGGPEMTGLEKLIAAATKFFENDKVDGKETTIVSNTEEGDIKPELVNSKCSCNKSDGEGDNAESTATEKGGLTVSEAVKTLAARLIGLAASPFEEKCEAALVNFSEAQLKSLIEQYEEPVKVDKDDDKGSNKPEVKASSAEEQVDEDMVTLTKVQHAEMLAASDAFKAQQQAEKDNLITLITNKTKLLTKEMLKDKNVDELQILATLVGTEPVLVPNLGQADVNDKDDEIPAPPSMKAAIDARRKELGSNSK